MRSIILSLVILFAQNCWAQEPIIQIREGSFAPPQFVGKTLEYQMAIKLATRKAIETAKKKLGDRFYIYGMSVKLADEFFSQRRYATVDLEVSKESYQRSKVLYMEMLSSTEIPIAEGWSIGEKKWR